MRVKTSDCRAFVTVCLNQILKCFLFFETHEIASTARVPQMVDKIKIRFAEDIGKPNRITFDTATFRMKRN